MDATIIIPTFDHGETLRFALASIAQQSNQNFEVFVIGDGVPEAHKPWLRAAVAADPRITLIDQPKHARRGEPYRHDVLQTACGKMVCYMTDRDIWLPHHLAQMAALLTDNDYAHALPLHVLPDASLRVFACDLTGPGYRYMMSTVMDNRMPFSSFAHTREAYFKLAEGWTDTPQDQWTDLYMWRKFLARPDLRGVSGTRATAVTFPSPPRKSWPMQQRLDELHRWATRLATSEARAEFERDALIAGLLAQRAETLKISSVLEATLKTQAGNRPRISYAPRY